MTTANDEGPAVDTREAPAMRQDTPSIPPVGTATPVAAQQQDDDGNVVTLLEQLIELACAPHPDPWPWQPAEGFTADDFRDPDPELGPDGNLVESPAEALAQGEADVAAAAAEHDAEHDNAANPYCMRCEECRAEHRGEDVSAWDMRPSRDPELDAVIAAAGLDPIDDFATPRERMHRSLVARAAYRREHGHAPGLPQPLPAMVPVAAEQAATATASAAPVVATVPEHPDFWSAHPELAHVRDFALARRASPWATLGCVLARVVAQVEPFVVLPAIVGGHGSLNLFIGLVGGSGDGKGAAEAVAADAFDYGDTLDPLVVEGVGSGEGVVHTYARFVPGQRGENGEPGRKARVEQHNTRALFRAPEVDTLAALKGRQGSTLLPKLRDAWSGDALGFAYADVTRRLRLDAHTYRLCLTVGIQPARAAVLLDDADGGTPQRFVWLPVRDAHAPDVAPPQPAPLSWHVPTALARSPIGGRLELPVCDTAVKAIDAAALARHRGEIGALDGHALLARLKVAAALALLLGDAEVGDEHWTRAGTVMAVSDQTRAGVLRTLGSRRDSAEAARGRAEGVRSVAAEQVREDHAVKRVRRKLLSKLDDTEWRPRSALRKQVAHRDRELFDEAIGALVRDGLVEEQEVAGTSQVGTAYRLAGGAA